MSTTALSTLTATIEKGFVRACAMMVIVMSVAVLVTHLVIGSLLTPHESATNRMQLVSQQAINAQEIVRLTSRLATEKDPGSLYQMRADLGNVLERFSDGHRRLVEGDQTADITSRMSQSAQNLISDPTNGLDRWTRDIEAAVARDFLGNNLGADIADAVALEEQIRLAYSTRLAQLIDQFANDSWISLRLIALVRVGFVALFFVSLAIVATMIFLPLSRRTVIMVRNQWLSDRADHAGFDPVTGFPNNDGLCQFIKSHCDLNWTHNLRQAILRVHITQAGQDIADIEENLPPELARALAGRIKSVCRQGDYIARVGPNEFAIAAMGLDNRPNVEALAERLMVRLDQAFFVEDEEAHVHVRIGVSFLDKSNRQIDEVLRQSEKALPRLGASENGSIGFFEKSSRKKRVPDNNRCRQRHGHKQYRSLLSTVYLQQWRRSARH